MPKMDRTAFSAYKKENEPSDTTYWRTKTIRERLEAANYLISVAYSFDINNPPRLDKTIFSVVKNGESI